MADLVEDKQLEAAFGASDIARLGRFLRDTLEKVSVFQYVNSATVAQRTNNFLERLADYVSIEPRLDLTSAEAVSADPTRKAADDLADVRREFQYGEVWNALAKLRRILEIELRQLAARYEIPAAARSAGNLLNLLERKNLVDFELARLLREIISVCNEGIHGFNVAASDAERVIDLAEQVLPRLHSLMSTS